MRGGAVCLPSKRFVGRGCQSRPALACHKYAGSLRINTTIFRSRAASPLAALLPYYTLKIRSIPSPVRRTGLGRQIYIENRQFSVSKDLPVILLIDCINKNLIIHRQLNELRSQMTDSSPQVKKLQGIYNTWNEWAHSEYEQATKTYNLMQQEKFKFIINVNAYRQAQANNSFPNFETESAEEFGERLKSKWKELKRGVK